MNKEIQVGLIGVGTMGTPIGLHILEAGFPLVVHDIRRRQIEPHVAKGAQAAESAKAVAEQCDVIFTSLPGPDEINDVNYGVDGLLAGISPGKVYFDLSTSSPSRSRELHAEYQKRGAHMLDAPVSGGPYGAESGKLAIWVGGDQEVFERYLPLLQTLGDEVLRVGDSGAASIAKLVHNCAGFVMYSSLAEVFSMGMKAGLEADILWQTIRKGLNGRRPLFDCLERNFMPHQYEKADFSLRLAEKDCRLALELAREFEVSMPLAETANQQQKAAMDRGWQAKDARVPMLLQMEQAGVEPPAVPVERVQEILNDNH